VTTKEKWGKIMKFMEDNPGTLLDVIPSPRGYEDLAMSKVKSRLQNDLEYGKDLLQATTHFTKKKTSDYAAERKRKVLASNDSIGSSQEDYDDRPFSFCQQRGLNQSTLQHHPEGSTPSAAPS